MLTGKILRDALISGANSIINNKHAIDELNVYPVPDGDTGTNMSMTMTAAVNQLQLLGDNVTVSKVADTAASALLRGARGNSGVILSLLFRGFSKGVTDIKNARNEHIARALELGVHSAYKAVMSPTEGTILTVARLASVKAKAIAKDNLPFEDFWAEVLAEAETALKNTPNLLPVLKKAGVVDAGGKGLCVIYEGMLEVFKGNPIVQLESKGAEKAEKITVVGDSHENITFTYCTEFIVEKNTDSQDPSALRAYLESIGDCVVVVDDDEIIKVHVHTDHPGNAIEKAITFGALFNLKIDNMRRQHEQKAQDARISREQSTVIAAPDKEYGFVAVCFGTGIAGIFKDLGVDTIVSGGQTMNPSTDDILKAIYSVTAEIVFVLPSNKNIIMAAEAAASLAQGREVIVLQTRTIPQSISAMMAFDDSANKTENRTAMTEAFSAVSTGQITYAARDSELDGKIIKKNEILALDNGKLSFTGSEITKTAYKLTRKLVKSDSSFITIIYGCDVTDDNAEFLRAALEKKLGKRAEITLINGGQPVYYYIIAVE